MVIQCKIPCLDYEWKKPEYTYYTLWAEKRTKDDSPKGTWSSILSETWCCDSNVPFENCSGDDDVGKEEPGENASGWGNAGDVRKGTAAGRTGEVKTGGPGGVLKWGTGLPVVTPLAGDKTFGVLTEREEAWSCCKCNFGGGKPGDEATKLGGGGIGLFSGFEISLSGVNPTLGCVGLAIEKQGGH